MGSYEVAKRMAEHAKAMKKIGMAIRRGGQPVTVQEVVDSATAFAVSVGDCFNKVMVAVRDLSEAMQRFSGAVEDRKR